MASAEQIKALLKSHIEGDNSHFFSVAMQVAAHEAKLGHGKLARELRAIIDEAKKKRYAVPSLKSVPIAQPRGELLTLLEASYLVHSTEWTEAMQDSFQPLNTENEYEQLLRYCGFGVPNLQSAMWNARNSLTLIAQDSLQPFDKKQSRYVTRDLNLHTIPWPKEVLQDLGETQVEMRVTLSYFLFHRVESGKARMDPQVQLFKFLPDCFIFLLPSQRSKIKRYFSLSPIPEQLFPINYFPNRI